MVREFISFTIGAEEYGIDIMNIREIKGWVPVTELPEAPPYMRGVIDLRGTMVPILDLRARFTGQRTEASARHVVMVVTIADQVAGILVDAVADILAVEEEAIQPVPHLNEPSHAFLSGLVTVQGRMVAILHLGHVFDLATLSAPSAA